MPGRDLALVDLEPVADGLAVGRAGDRERRQVVAVTAQRDGQQLPGAGPVLALGLGREDVVDQPGDGDQIPFEPLGAVHGEHLDPFGLDLDLTDVQAVLFDLGRLEEAEEGPQRRLVGLGREPGRLVEEAVEMDAADAGPRCVRGHLDVDADDPLDVGDQLGQRRAEPVAQRLQLAAQPVEAAEADSVE